MSHERPPPVRLVDRCVWRPWAMITDNGLPLMEMSTERFMIVTETDMTILRMIGRHPPLYGQPMIKRPR